MMKGVKNKTYQLKYAWYATNLSLGVKNGKRFGMR
jgi:hypothetical protein